MRITCSRFQSYLQLQFFNQIHLILGLAQEGVLKESYSSFSTFLTNAGYPNMLPKLVLGYTAPNTLALGVSFCIRVREVWHARKRDAALAFLQLGAINSFHRLQQSASLRQHYWKRPICSGSWLSLDEKSDSTFQTWDATVRVRMVRSRTLETPCQCTCNCMWKRRWFDSCELRLGKLTFVKVCSMHNFKILIFLYLYVHGK